MSAETLRSAWCFDRFRIDLARGALLGEGGAEIPLRPKSFALLRHLVENAGRLIDRNEIMQAVWPGVIVTEDSIAQCVKEIRRALGDDDMRLLRTLPRRGFLFAATPERIGLDAAPVAAVPRPAGPLAPPPSGRPMVVVLPFETIGTDPEQGYFAEGLTADLVTDLARFQALHVVSPRRHGPGQAHAPSGSPWPEIALPRGAGYAVAGSLRRAGGRIRVTARLEDARSGVQFWAERFDRPLDDLFAVQEELAERIAVQLISQVTQEVLRRARRRPPASLDAYDLVLQGRALHRRGTEADTLAAREAFARALAADPDHAPAYAWQAFTVQRGFTHGWGEPRGRAALGPALALASRAVEIEPDSCLCLARLAFILLQHRRHEEALETGRAAILANPSDFESRYAYGLALSHTGEPGEAVRELRLAMSLDPFCPPSFRASLGRALLLGGSRRRRWRSCAGAPRACRTTAPATRRWWSPPRRPAGWRRPARQCARCCALVRIGRRGASTASGSSAIPR